MVKKIFIIEDVEPDYLDLCSVLLRYNVDYFPNDKTAFDLFRNELERYAKFKKEDDLTPISSKMIAFKPDLVFLDLSLLYGTDDLSGIAIREKVIDNDLRDSKVCVLTQVDVDSAGVRDYDDYINKDTPQSLKYELEAYLDSLGISKRPVQAAPPPAAANDVKENLDESAKAPLTRRNKISIFLNNTFWPYVGLVIDTVIRFSFYCWLLFLFGLSIYILVRDVFHDIRSIQIAEHFFVGFLPFLVVFGFFVFYQQSLRQFITGARTVNVDYTSSSKLMNLTKKLFVSSLVSYLSIKLVELISNEAPSDNFKRIQRESEPDSIATYFHQHPLLQVYLLAGTIVILILYYVYLNQHKEESRQTSHP